jgi:hypothetical protein
LMTVSSARILVQCATNASQFLGEVDHAVRDWVPLVLEEHGKITLRHVPQQYAFRPRARFSHGPVWRSPSRVLMASVCDALEASYGLWTGFPTLVHPSAWK